MQCVQVPGQRPRRSLRHNPELLLGHQRVADQRCSLPLCLVHRHRGNLAVVVGLIVVGARPAVAAAGLIRNVPLPHGRQPRPPVHARGVTDVQDLTTAGGLVPPARATPPDSLGP